jgi:ubiquinone/menaquinone biosynthesis C-methylase UbiE
MSSIEADFNRLALLDEEGWTTNNHYHSFLLEHVPENCENALEIGCGTGAFARQLAQRCRRVIALDLSAEMIRVARSRSTGVDNLEYQWADAMSWSFSQSHFDFVCSIATLHHLDQRELLVKIRHSLRPGGVFALLDLVQSSSLIELALDVLALGISPSLRLVHNGRLQPPAEVRKAWEQHGRHDHYSTVREMRVLAEDVLPGSTLRRHLLWRYSLVYKKPATDLHG